MKIYWCDKIKDYVFENCFKNDYYDYDVGFSVWKMSEDSNTWNKFLKTSNMILIAIIK